MAENKEKKSLWSKIKKFFRDYRSEFKKLVWPTGKQLLKNATVVLTAVIVVGAVLALLDYGLSIGIGQLKNLINFIRPVS